MIKNYPVNNIHCLALNYKGVGNDNHPPLYFLKSKACLTYDGGTVPYPRFRTDKVWTEAELAIVVGRNNTIKGLMVAGDITCENICGRDHHLPMAKARTGFCPISSVLLTQEEVDINSIFTLTTTINGIEKQRGTTADMKYNLAESIDYISQIVDLQYNDIILTGTPNTPRGGPQFDCLVHPKDKVSHRIEGLGEINYSFGD